MADILGVDMRWYPDNWFYGVDGEYHPPGMVYKPSVGDDGKYYYYHSESHPYKLEGPTQEHPSSYGSPGSFLGIDGKRHQSGYYYGVDGEYHHPDTHYNIITGKYTPPPPPKR